MRLISTSGKLVSKRVYKYLIDWDGKSRSKIQFKVKQFLRPFWIGAMVYEEFPVYGSQLKVDFFNASSKIIVEVNGRQHYDYVKFFHKNRFGFKDHIKRDVKKYEWAKANDIQFIEINEDEIPKLSKQFMKDNFDLEL